MSECQRISVARPKRHRPPTTDRAINLQQIVLQSRPTNQEACHVTKHPPNLSLLVFSEDDYCLCLWRWIEQATSKHPLSPSSLFLHCTVTGDTIWWWNVSVRLPHVTSTRQRAPSLTVVKAVNMTGTQKQFSSLRRWRMKCFFCGFEW